MRFIKPLGCCRFDQRQESASGFCECPRDERAKDNKLMETPPPEFRAGSIRAHPDSTTTEVRLKRAPFPELESSVNPQPGKAALRIARFPACGFWWLSSRPMPVLSRCAGSINRLARRTVRVKPPAKLRFVFERVCAIWLALAFGLFGEVTGRAAKILYVVSAIDDPTTPTPANDQEVATRLQSQGHTVTAADDQDPALGDYFAGQDLILISSSVGSGNQPLNSLAISTLRNGRTPIVCYEPGLYDELLFQTATTFGNAAGHTSLALSVANQTHPLTAGKSGTIDIANPPDTAVVSSSAFPLTLGQDAIIIATNAT